MFIDSLQQVCWAQPVPPLKASNCTSRHHLTLHVGNKRIFGQKCLWKREVWWKTCLSVLLAARTLYGTVIQVSATAFCTAWVNTNSISLSGNSQVASWQDFWAECESIVRGTRVFARVFCPSLVHLRVHLRFSKLKYWLNSEKIVWFLCPSVSWHCFPH